MVVEEQEEQVVKLRKSRGGFVGELVESEEETSNKVACFPTTTTNTSSSSTDKRQHFLKPSQQLNFVFLKTRETERGRTTCSPLPRQTTN